MKIILLKGVENLGEEGQIVDVKNGFGRNYLIPKRLARLATPNAIKAKEEEHRQASRKLAKKTEDAEILAKEIESIELVITAKVGEENRIFGSVTSQDISDSLAGHGIQVDRRKIHLDSDIRLLGVYTASVKVHSEVMAQVKVRVESETGAKGATAGAATEDVTEAVAEPVTEEKVETPIEEKAGTDVDVTTEATAEGVTDSEAEEITPES